MPQPHAGGRRRTMVREGLPAFASVPVTSGFEPKIVLLSSTP